MGSIPTRGYLEAEILLAVVAERKREGDRALASTVHPLGLLLPSEHIRQGALSEPGKA